ncbi:MAG: hypothetical protein ACXWLM_05580 [Myxococcales bacterium]
MTTIEKRMSPSRASLQRAFTEAGRITRSGVKEIRQEGREFGVMAKSEFRDLAGQARKVFARDCVRLGNELSKLGRRLEHAKPVRKAVRKTH